MPLELRQVTSASEVPEIIEGWMKHECHLTPTLNAVNWGDDESSFQDQVQDLTTRRWFTHVTVAGSVWLKVVDTDLGDKVVAASQWVIYTNGVSTRAAPPARLYWLPPGPERSFNEGVRNSMAAVRTGPTRHTPHVRKSVPKLDVVDTKLVESDLMSNYTVAEHRRRGANTLMIEWGTKKADELGLETWLEATPLGSMIYTKNGFRLDQMVELSPPAELREDDDKWRHLEEVYKDYRLAIMRRPVNGVWNDDKQDAEALPTHDLGRNVWLKCY